MLLTADAREPLVIVKAGSAAKLALQSTCRDITPGCHMSSSHWIVLSPSGDVPTLLIDDLVTTPSALVEHPPPPPPPPPPAKRSGTLVHFGRWKR
ncbi:putative DNA-binding protein (MmcQ/YjbR family) [Leucobacter luti]|nr:putative DNA-binding protein (MmcQ/YjbR family) [Leucobacter luti]